VSKTVRGRKRDDAIRSASFAAAAGPPVGAPDAPEPSPGRARTRRTPLAPGRGLWVLSVAGAGAVACVGGAWGSPPLAGAWTVSVVATAAIIASVFLGYAWTNRSTVSTRTAMTTSLMTGALSVFFLTGLATNPVIIEGDVQLNTSSSARGVRYVETMRDDVYELRNLDNKLSASDAAAWASPEEYDSAKIRVEEIGRTYRDVLENTAPPAGELADPTRRTLAAAYTLTKAYEAKIGLLRTDDSKLRTDLSAARKTFADELVSAGASLSEAVTALNYTIDLTDVEESS
jgi:hypothetical protein